MNDADAEASLINDVQFLEELERFEVPGQRRPDPTLEAVTYDDAVDALDEGLAVDAVARPFSIPDDERPVPADTREPAFAPVATERRVPLMAAALVIGGCLIVGAATAAYVFHDRVAQITAPRSATR